MSDKSDILIVSNDSESRQGLRQILEKAGYSVLSRESIERTVQLLELSEVSLVISEEVLSDGNFLDLLKEVKQEELYYADTPVYVIGDGDKTESCIQAFDAGAEDFSGKPINKKIFLARVQRLIKNHEKIKNNPVSLSVRVEASEVPGIFQFLEVERKTGFLKAYHKKEFADVVFSSGKIVFAETEFCAGADALTEILSWPFVQFQFREKEVDVEKYDMSLDVSRSMMDCVFEVDEYREALKRLPDAESSFVQGRLQLPKNSNGVAKKVHRFAVSGSSLEEIIDTLNINKRHLLLLIDQLVAGGYMAVAPEPFDEYLNQHKKWYQGRTDFYSKVLGPMVNVLEGSDFQYTKTLKDFDYSSRKDWDSSPTLYIAGDDHEFNKELFDSLMVLSAYFNGRKSKVESKRSYEAMARLDFKTGESLNLHLLPPKLDQVFLKNIKEQDQDVFGLVFIASKQDHDTASANRRRLRKLREIFKGSYLIVVPQADEEDTEFLIDCSHCSHKLAVDMDLAGSIGTCPICNTEITIPDCLDHVNWSLKLPDEVPCILMQPANVSHAKDVFELLLSSLLESFSMASV